MVRFLKNYIPRQGMSPASQLYGYINNISWDLKIVSLFQILLAGFVFIPPLNESFLRYILGFLCLMFMPGYALMAAICPGRSDLDVRERLVLSVTASIAAVPIIGFALNFTQWGIRLYPMLLLIIASTVACVLIANHRRNSIPPEKRYSPEFKRPMSEALAYVSAAGNDFNNRALNAVLILTLIAMAASTVYLVITPGAQEKFTELYLMTVDGQNGYPHDFYAGYSQPIIAGVANHEHQDMDYDLAVVLKSGDNRTVLQREKFTIGHNQTWEKRFDLMPETAGQGQKIVFELFANGEGYMPYRTSYLWVNVSPSGDPYTDIMIFGANRSLPLSITQWYVTGNRTSGGKSFDVTIVNHEYRTVPYRFEIIMTNNTTRGVLFSENMTLEHNETWSDYVPVWPDREGANLYVEFNLYMDGNTSSPYRQMIKPTNVTRIGNVTTLEAGTTPGTI